ncbi:MAG TPA: nucleotidyltransferase family protein [Candidatus Avisuccinivibrio pullicola]|nr:nucleotidyltransferase family protein [Candidatus Avisuccinivibrio pullicola]
MLAMILAAGRGDRLRPLTDSTPKPLIEVGGKPLLQWHIERLRDAGIREMVINSAWLSEQIVAFAGDGERFGVRITHSVEGPGGLETAGGIIKALPHLGKSDEDCFVVVNADTFMDVDYRTLLAEPHASELARLFLVPNPAHHKEGDFDLAENGKVHMGSGYTFSGAAVYRVGAFRGHRAERVPLRPYFEQWSTHNAMCGSLLEGAWFDVGTVERLEQVRAYWNSKQAS